MRWFITNFSINFRPSSTKSDFLSKENLYISPNIWFYSIRKPKISWLNEYIHWLVTTYICTFSCPTFHTSHNFYVYVRNWRPGA